MSYRLLFTKQAQKDAKKINRTNLRTQAEKILDLIKTDPFILYPAYERILGNLSGAYSRRINIKHRIVYQVLEDQKIIKILRMWTHYE